MVFSILVTDATAGGAETNQQMTLSQHICYRSGSLWHSNIGGHSVRKAMQCYPDSWPLTGSKSDARCSSWFCSQFTIISLTLSPSHSVGIGICSSMQLCSLPHGTPNVKLMVEWSSIATKITGRVSFSWELGALINVFLSATRGALRAAVRPRGVTEVVQDLQRGWIMAPNTTAPAAALMQALYSPQLPDVSISTRGMATTWGQARILGGGRGVTGV